MPHLTRLVAVGAEAVALVRAPLHVPARPALRTTIVGPGLRAAVRGHPAPRPQRSQSARRRRNARRHLRATALPRSEGRPTLETPLRSALGLALAPLLNRPYRRLSGGEQQAVNLAGALVGRPELVLLDEPTAGMDPRARRRTWDLITGLRADGVAVLLTTHDMAEAAHLADRVWIMDAGRVTVSGTVAELTADASLEDVFLRHTGGAA